MTGPMIPDILSEMIGKFVGIDVFIVIIDI